MPVINLPCGDYVNFSEEKACTRLRDYLSGLPGNANWYFISNLYFSQNNSLPKEIDLIVLARNGFHLIEIKNWGPQYVSRNMTKAESAVNTLHNKGQQLNGLLQQVLNINVAVYGKFLFTGENKNSYKNQNNNKFPVISGVRMYGIDDCRYLFDLHLNNNVFTDEQMEKVANLLMNRQLPRPGTFEKYFDLKLISGGKRSFRNVYDAKFRENAQAKVTPASLYVYDLTMTSRGEDEAELIARREFKALQAIQTSTYAPQILETYQDASDYPGEIHYFSVYNRNYPSISKRFKKPWKSQERLFSAIECFRALKSFHSFSEDGEKILHRNITPANILIKESGRPVFKGFIFSRVDGQQTVLGFISSDSFSKEYSAPELFEKASSERSDIYSLCKSLLTIFPVADDFSNNVIELLEKGLAQDPQSRPEVDWFIAELEKIQKKHVK